MFGEIGGHLVESLVQTLIGQGSVAEFSFGPIRRRATNRADVRHGPLFRDRMLAHPQNRTESGELYQANFA
jgi:hypothetical protein